MPKIGPKINKIEKCPFSDQKNGTSSGQIKIPYFNFVDFRAYFGPFSLVKSAKTKIFPQTSIFGL